MPKRNTEAFWVESAQRWQINVQCNGKRKTFVSSKPGRKGKLEAERKADAWLEKGMVDDTAKVFVLLDMFLDDVKLRNGERSSSYRQTEQFIRLYIKPVIGSKKMSALTAGDCQRVIDTAHRTKQLSKKTLMGVRSCITSFLKWGRMNGKTVLLVEGLRIPVGAKKSQKSILQPEALKTLFTDGSTRFRRGVREEAFIWAFRFAVVTGFRPGELIALRHKDIKGRHYSLKGAINIMGDHTTGKNENAIRSGELSDLAVYILNQQRINLIRRGIVSDYIFPDADGEPMREKNYYRHWKGYCAYHGITEGTTPYELRHTFVSVNDEMPDGLKKMLMGHSKSMDTEGVYGHKKHGDDQRAAKYIDDAFAPYAECVPECVPEK